jgi:hypothetical protein
MLEDLEKLMIRVKALELMEKILNEKNIYTKHR